MRKFSLHSLLGFGVVILTFVGGLLLTQLIPGMAGRYMSPKGETMVGGLIFLSTLATALLARFESGVLFGTLALTATFEVAFLVFLSGGTWSIVFIDMREIWSHTLLPVLCSAIVLPVIRIIKRSN
jgi:hypothetical protein